jgi:hypothetical protein
MSYWMQIMQADKALGVHQPINHPLMVGLSIPI